MDYLDYKKLIGILIVSLLLLSGNVLAIKMTSEKNKVQTNKNPFQFSNLNDVYGDHDPLCNINLTINIKSIRALDKIDAVSYPDFFVKLFVNNEMKESKVWKNSRYIQNPNWSATFDVPDDKEIVNITMELWDENKVFDKKCDIGVLTKKVNLFYSLKTGHWYGDDYINPYVPVLFDKSGYGRLNGCDDNSLHDIDRDCEILFDITQTDPDGDNIPYYSEVEVYGTDPEVDNTGMDCDNDGVPIEWEHKWGHYFDYNWHTQKHSHQMIYDPFEYENHSNIDLDKDGLDNIEEYRTSQWGSDPFRKDIFLEIDRMENCYIFKNESKRLMTNSFAKQNIVLHIDDGCMNGGGDIIPFKEKTNYSDLQSFYFEYFLNNDSEYWRRGVFHYALMLNNSGIEGNAFSTSINGKKRCIDSFQISTSLVEKNHCKDYIYQCLTRGSFNKEQHKIVALAGVTMHELGHTLGLFSSNVIGVDIGPGTIDGDRYDRIKMLDRILWYILFGNYKSVMNYGYVYSDLVDYSDGSRGRYDNDDWGTIDLTFFQNEF